MLHRAVVVASWMGGLNWLLLSLESLLGCKYPVVIVVNGTTDRDQSDLDAFANFGTVLPLRTDHYECGAIRGVLEHTVYDEFVFLQDSIEVLDLMGLDQLFAVPHSACAMPRFECFLGKFRRDPLLRIEIPEPRTKDESILLGEQWFLRAYQRVEPVEVLYPTFDDAHAKGIIEKFGRRNLVLENQYFRKWKGRWWL